MGDDIRKIYDELSSLGSITVPYDQFADAYTNRADYKQKIDNAYTELFPDVKKKDVSQSPSVSASGVTSSPSQGDTIKVDGKEIPYAEFLAKYVKGEEVFGAPVELEEAPVAPEMSTAENLWNSTKIGLLNLQQAIFELPKTLYNIAAIPQNIVADQFNIPSLETNYDNFLAQTSSKGMSAGTPLELIDEIAKMSAQDIEALQAKKQQDGLTISEIYDTQGFGPAAEKVGEYVLESLPISIASMAGGVAGASRAMAMGAPSAVSGFSAVGSGLTAGALSFPSHKKELEKYELEQWESDGLALIFSGLESVFEGPANKMIASQTAKVLLENGEDAARDFATNATKAIFNKAMVPLLGASASGSSSEMATRYSQNLVKKLTVDPEINVFEGVADAGFVGAVSDPLMVGAPLSYKMVGNTANHFKTRKQRKAAISEIEAALEDESLPVEVRDNLANAREALIKDFNASEMSVNAMYDGMSSEDKSEVTEISKKILSLSRALGRRDLTDVQRQAIEGTFTELSFQKAQIESKYQKPISDDSENQIGLPGQVVQGQEPVQAQPIEGAGQETPQAGGVLQVPVQEEIAPDYNSVLNELVSKGVINEGQRDFLLANPSETLKQSDFIPISSGRYDDTVERDFRFDIYNSEIAQFKRDKSRLDYKDEILKLKNVFDINDKSLEYNPSLREYYKEVDEYISKMNQSLSGLTDDERIIAKIYYLENEASINRDVFRVSTSSEMRDSIEFINREKLKSYDELYEYISRNPNLESEILDKIKSSGRGFHFYYNNKKRADKLQNRQEPIFESDKEPSLGRELTSLDIKESLIPSDVTAEDIQDVLDSTLPDFVKANISRSEVSTLNAIYRIAKKAASGSVNFTDEELSVYAENQDIISRVIAQIRQFKEKVVKREEIRAKANNIAQRVMNNEISDDVNEFYSQYPIEVEAAIHEYRATQGRAAGQLPFMVRFEKRLRAPKKVVMTDKALVRQRIFDMISGAKGAVKSTAEIQESVKSIINELISSGKATITTRQANSLLNAALDIRLNRPSSAKRFADTYERIVKGAELDAQKKKASVLRDKLKVVAKQRFTPFNIKEVVSEFLSVDPNRTDDIGVYIQMAEAMMAVAKSRNINKSSIERILPYIDGQDSLSRAINRKPLKGYAQEARMRGYMNEVIMAYVQDQFDQAREVRMDAIAEAAGISREELDSSVAQMSEDEILSGYYDADGNTITMPDGSRRTIEKDIVERMRNTLSRDGISTDGMSDREVQDLFVRNQERVKSNTSEKSRALVNAKVSIIRTEGLSDAISSAKYRDVSGLSLRELSALNSILDNIINNGSQANAGNAKILLEKTGRVEQIKDVLARKKVSNFTEKLFGVIGADKFNKRPVFFRFDQIIEQISGRADIGTILDELGYNDFRVNEAASDVILVNARKAINEATAQINKKYGVDITSAENKVKATILQLFVQARNPMNKQNESIIVNSILDNLRATANVYSQGNAESIEIADAINTFLNRVGTPEYVDNVVGFAMLDAVEAEAKKYSGAPVSEYVDIWKGIHEQHVDMYADYLETYRNERLKRENNYTAISVVKSGASMDGFFDEFDPAAQSSSEINVFARINKQFNRLIAAPKSKNFIERNPSYQLSDGDFYNMNFTSIQDKALNASVRESVVGPSIRTMASMASSSGAIKLFNTSASDNTNSEALSTTLSNEIGAEYAFRNFDFQSVQIIKNIAGTAIFGSVFEQFFKQSGPALLATQIRTTMYNKRAAGATAKAIKFVATSRSNPKSKALIDALLAKSDVQQRDLTATVVDPTSQLKVIGSKINGMKNASKFFGVVNEATTQIRNLTMMPLRQGDRVAAQASYLAFLDEAYLSKYGKQFTYEEMLEKNDPEMFAKASFELRSAQNVNSGKAMAQALRPGDSNASFVQATLLSWGSFAVNFKAGLYNDIANLRNAKDKESAQMAMASVSARLSEAISYSALLVYGLPLLYSGIGSALFGADDEYTEGLDDFLQSEEKFKRFYSRIISEVIPAVNNIPGVSQMTLLVSDLLLEGLNHLYYTMSPMEREQDLTKSDAERIGILPFKTYPTEAQDLLGKYTTSLQLASDAKESLTIASTGKYTDEKGNTYYYDEQQRRALYKIGTVQAMASAGFTLSEVKSAANASLRAIRATKYKDEFERYIQAESIEAMPEDYIKEADRTLLELMRAGKYTAPELVDATRGYVFKYSELYSKMQSVGDRAAGILLYNRVKDEPSDVQDSIVGEIAYRAEVQEKNSLKIFEEYMFEKNRVEKLGYTKDEILKIAEGMVEKLEKTPQKLEELDKKENAKKIDKRLEEIGAFINQELDKQ